MAKSKYIYVCNQCGYESSKWNGKCPSCGSWNSFEEELRGDAKASPLSGSVDLSDKIIELSDIGTDSDIRYDTGIGELNRVLGGGLVKGSIVLLGGEPGIGKSTILLQICQFMGEEHSILYVSGEESARQIKLRAERLSVDSQNLYILTANDAEAVCDTINNSNPDIVIIDSIQTMSIPQISSSPGSLTQVRECTNLFMRTAKSREIPIIIVGHVNKDGAIAGPKVMEHIVDAVLYFEGERHMSYRILRAVKNRFGSTNEIGVFEMIDSGLKEVENPSQMLLSGRPHDVSGTCVSCIMEGSRPILAEVQALASKTSYSAPRRMTTGFDFNRLTIIIAVMEKRIGIFMNTLDIYLNVVGGFRLDEPAGDLSVALAIYSSIIDRPISEKLIAFGEIGLGGEIRSVSHIIQRIHEAERMGFENCIVPRQSLSGINQKDFKINIIGVNTLKQAFSVIE
ncbi:MAG: DNA repair protein RadA [Oscillospiraceae bacterium]|nr:DNA repair protein RadA [Oscillospiraceae bacterium]